SPVAYPAAPAGKSWRPDRVDLVVRALRAGRARPPLSGRLLGRWIGFSPGPLAPAFAAGLDRYAGLEAWPIPPGRAVSPTWSSSPAQSSPDRQSPHGAILRCFR